MNGVVYGFSRRFGFDPPPLAMHGYGAVKTLIAAIQVVLAKELPLNGETIRDAPGDEPFGERLSRDPLRAEGEALELLTFVGLEGEAERPVNVLSLGQRKRLELAMALSTKPKLLLLDEPLAGLDPSAFQEIMALLKRAKAKGVSLFFIEHPIVALLGI